MMPTFQGEGISRSLYFISVDECLRLGTRTRSIGRGGQVYESEIVNG